ncbi:unnamed protein product [Heterobilharzia americana]|nr:unnamed protein product [Heterobilharzia americana]
MKSVDHMQKENHFHTSCVSYPKVKSSSMQDIANSYPSVQSDRITRYASPNRFDVRSAPNSFLDSYRSYRFPHKPETYLNRSKIRSTMRTSISSYAVTSPSGCFSNKPTPSSTAQNLQLTSGVRSCDKNISSECPKELPTKVLPYSCKSTEQCSSSTRQLIKHPNLPSNNNNNDHTSSSFVKDSPGIPSPHITSNSLSSSGPPNMQPYHFILPKNQLQQRYLLYKAPSNHAVPISLSHSEIPKSNLLPNKCSYISQTTINSNVKYNVHYDINNQMKANIPPASNDCSALKSDFEKQWNKNNSHLNYDILQSSSSNAKEQIIGIQEDSLSTKLYSSSQDQTESIQNHNDDKINNNKYYNDYSNTIMNSNNNNYNAPIYKQIIYPFKGNSFRSVKNNHKNKAKTIGRQQKQQEENTLNHENESNSKPEIKLIDSRPRTRLYIQSGTKTHTKTMTLQKDLVTDDSLNDQEFNKTGFISLPDRRPASRRGNTRLPTSPSMPLPSETPSGRWIYNVSLSEMDYNSEPYSICTSLVECKQTDIGTVDSQNDPELTDKLDLIACKIGLLHRKNYTGRKDSRSSQHDISGLMSSIDPCSESNLSKVDLDQYLAQKTSTPVSNPASTSSLINKTTVLQTSSTSSTSPKITDSRYRSHLSRVDSTLAGASKTKPQNRPSSTGSRIFKEFLRHISPKLRRSFSGLSSRKKCEHQKSNQNVVDTDVIQEPSSKFERVKSEHNYSKSLLWLIPRCSSRSKENKRKGKIATEEVYQTTECPLNIDIGVSNSNPSKAISSNTATGESYISDASITPTVTLSSEIQPRLPFSPSTRHPSLCSHFHDEYYEQHHHKRPLSIALPIDKERDKVSLDFWNDLQMSHQNQEGIFSRHEENDNPPKKNHPEPVYLNAALNAFGYGYKPDWKHFCVSPSARRLAHTKSMRMRQSGRNSLDLAASYSNSSRPVESYDGISDGTGNCSDNQNEEKFLPGESENIHKNTLNLIESKPKQTVGYYCHNHNNENHKIPTNDMIASSDSRLFKEEAVIFNDEDCHLALKDDERNIAFNMNVSSKQHPTVSMQHSPGEYHLMSTGKAQLFDTFPETDENGQYFSKPQQLAINLKEESEAIDNETKASFNHVLSAIPSRTPPIKRRNTAIAIKAKATRLRQSSNSFLPTTTGHRDRLSAAVSKATITTDQSEYIQPTKKKELSTLYETEHSPTEQGDSNCHKVVDPRLSPSISSSFSGSSSFSEKAEHVRKMSSSSNDLHNRVEISTSPSDWIGYVKNLEINRSDMELSANDDVDCVINLLRNVHTFESQLMNVIAIAKNELEKYECLEDDKWSTATSDVEQQLTSMDIASNSEKTDELLTGIGHAQMLISGNLTTLSKLCKLYLEAKSQIKKQQPIDYIPLRSDLEGYWDLILLQYGRFELQFPLLCSWISKEFRTELQQNIKKSVGEQFMQKSESLSPRKLDYESRKITVKNANTITRIKNKNTSGSHANSVMSNKSRTAVRERIASARKQMIKRISNKTVVNDSDNNKSEPGNSKSGNSLFYTIE